MGRDITYLLVDNPEIVDNLGMIVPAPISNDQQVLMRTLSHPPGFDPKIISQLTSQPMESHQASMYKQYPLPPNMVQHSDQIQWAKNPWVGSQTETTSYQESKDVMQVVEGAKNHDQIPLGPIQLGGHNPINPQQVSYPQRATMPVSASIPIHGMHYTHQGYLGP